MPVDPARLARTLAPTTVAVVGVSERSPLADNIRGSVDRGVDIHFVHPREDTVFGRPVHRSLRDLPVVPDCVFTATGAAHVPGLAREAVEIGAGGIVTIAAGFGEGDGEGADLGAALLKAARDEGLPIVGPNGVGLIDVRRGISLTMLAPFARRAGGASVVTHSGALLGAMAAAAHRAGGLGFNLLISAGNEPVSDLADYLGFLADDPETSVILLAYEKIRRPGAFFAAAARARQNGKPIIAIKLGRSERSRRVAASHTGSVTGDAWVYDVAMRQAGIQIATDIDDLIDRAHLLERLPREKWTRAEGVAVISATGGFAQLAGDLAPAHDLALPELDAVKPFLRARIPGAGDVANPLDSTTAVNALPELWEELVRTYEADPDVDALYFANQHEAWDERFRVKSDGFAKVAADSQKPFLLAPIAGEPGAWVADYERTGTVIGNGLEGCLKGLATMGAFMRTRPDARVPLADDAPSIPRPEGPWIPTPAGTMLGFSATMRVLADAGFHIAPFHVFAESETVAAPGFEGPYVVKIADAPHRTDIGGVRIGVDAASLAAAVDDLRIVARDHGVPADIAVQQMVAGRGEVFFGLTRSELGPAVAFGLGGIFVEVLGRVGGRMAPLSLDDARELVAEFDDLPVMEGHRGSPPWDREAICTALVAAGRLAADGRAWIASFDLNPLIVTADGPVVVDGLCLRTDDDLHAEERMFR